MDRSKIEILNPNESRLNVRNHDSVYILTKLKLFGEGLEVGCYMGSWANHVLTLWEGKKLYSIDPYDLQPPEYGDASYTKEDWEWIYQKAKERLLVWGDRHELIRSKSVDACSKFKDGQLDFVYIDGLHTEWNTKEDMESWWPKIREGGLMFGDDYRKNWPGVITAVNDFRDKYKVPVFFSRSGYDTTSLGGIYDSGLDDWFIFK